MKPSISLFFHDIPKIPLQVTEVKQWLIRVTELYNAPLKSLRIILCADEYLSKLNIEYLKHDTLTDIITFPYHEKGKPIEGELYISLERVRENAETLNLTTEQELDRVIVHGLLHLIGYEDHTPEQKEAMRREEDKCLSLRP
ncbi:MAG: rRNA maturation RNase YbeY [Bacteroidales bacterium]